MSMDLRVRNNGPYLISIEKGIIPNFVRGILKVADEESFSTRAFGTQHDLSFRNAKQLL